IGPNGAGKTTLVNLITGALKPPSGRALLNGEELTGLSQTDRARRGLGSTFQIDQLFRRLSVFENIAMSIRRRAGPTGNLVRSAAHANLSTRPLINANRFDLSMMRSNWFANWHMGESAL